MLKSDIDISLCTTELCTDKKLTFMISLSRWYYATHEPFDCGAKHIFVVQTGQKRDVRFIFFKKKKKEEKIVTGEGAQLSTPQTQKHIGTQIRRIQGEIGLSTTHTDTQNDICAFVCFLFFIFKVLWKERKKNPSHHTSHRRAFNKYANTTQKRQQQQKSVSSGNNAFILNKSSTKKKEDTRNTLLGPLSSISSMKMYVRASSTVLKFNLFNLHLSGTRR